MNKQVLKLGALAVISFGEVLTAQEKKDSLQEKSIQELVVVAFGKQKKEEITGAIQEVKSKDIAALQNNPETIWGFDNNSQTKSIGNFYASFFSMFDSMNEGYAGAAGIYKIIDKRLYDEIPSTDYRKKVFNGPNATNYTFNGKTKTHPAYVSRKFKDTTFFEGDYIYIRASSLYYIQAEALARLGREAEARQVLFEITSKRDTGYALSTKSGQNLIDEIILQKRIELWGEGYAWFDMKRLNVALERDYTGSNHTFGKFNIPAGSNKFRFQIPLSEVNNNPSIVQNPAQ